MIIRRKCPHCHENCISVIQVLQLLLGQPSQSCSVCNKEFQLTRKGLLTPLVFWVIEAVMYFSLISISLQYKSWMILSYGLLVTLSVEMIMLLSIPVSYKGPKDRIDKMM